MLLSAFAGMCVAGSAQAAELAPMEGLSITLGDVSGTAYYTVEKDGYQVVATVASGVNATPVRFATTLLSGQKASLSVPRAVGQSALTVEIERIEDRIFVNGGAVISGLAH
jgi:hypothetical protein